MVNESGARGQPIVVNPKTQPRRHRTPRPTAPLCQEGLVHYWILDQWSNAECCHCHATRAYPLAPSAPLPPTSQRRSISQTLTPRPTPK
jgi:hypothetical protein